MRKYCWRKVVLPMALFCIFVFHTEVLAEVDKLSINQMIQNGNNVFLYVSVLDDEGRPVTETLPAERFSVLIDKDEMLIPDEAARFQSLEEGMNYVFCIDISKSVTEQEMQEIRAGISAFVNGMTKNDYAGLITIGTEITSICDLTQDKNSLNLAIEKLDRTANKTYLYKGLSYALDRQRKKFSGMPERTSIILFTDGMDDSDGASSEDEILLDIAETRIPIYVVGLKGNDSVANLNSVGQIARQSGGSVYSYNDMSIAEAMETINEVVKDTYVLHVLPEESSFGKQNLIWKTTYSAEGYTVSSSNYVFSLGMENVVFAEPETESETEPTTEPEQTDLSDPETEEKKQEWTETKTAMVSQTEEEPGGETESETGVYSDIKKNETGSGTVSQIWERAKAMVEDYFYILIAAFLILISLVIILIVLLRGGRKKKRLVSDTYQGPLGYSGFEQSSLNSFGEETVDERQDMEKTIDESGFENDDDERTVDGFSYKGIKLRFKITFEGQTKVVERTLVDQLTLGRGDNCDIDVVLQSTSEERKLTSRLHASIINRPDGLYVRDEGARNKTYINGVEVDGERPLRDEDVLQLGNAMIQIKILQV